MGLNSKLLLRRINFHNFIPMLHILYRGATRILLRVGLKMENFCDIILIAYFR